jgi:SAM-dependent methyltransferase
MPPAPTPPGGELDLSAADLARMGAEWCPGASSGASPPSARIESPRWPVVSSISELGDQISPVDRTTSEEAIPVDDLGLELAYGVERAEAEPAAPAEPLFRADVVPGADEEAILPFVLPRGEAEVASPAPPRRREAPAPPPPWFERFFDLDYLELEPQASPKLTRREVDFFLASMALAQGARILDLGCGVGRHALELAARGYQVVGLDLSRTLLERAVQEGRARRLAVDFVHGDVRNLAFRKLFDAVLFWGNTFGYFRDAENALVLHKVAQALRPGGRLLLQCPNRDFYLRELPCARWRRAADALILDEVDLDSRTSRFRVRRSVLRSDGRERFDALDFRAYALHELLDLLASEGFVPLEISGRVTTRGAYFGGESPSIIVLAEIR